ncbi:MAG TPA: hypothetical protein VHO70_17630 [Chitinispirillaceae bacterium]|nr:hypothetical protein [Chitinispirillaceae bacterium]
MNKIIKALSDFGGPTIEAVHLSKPGSVFRMGSPPIQIDIINQASGISFEECYKRKTLMAFDDIEISVISRDDLIKNKKASGRIQDEADAEKLS